MRHLGQTVRARLLIGAAASVLACSTGFAHAQTREPITIAPQSLATALYEFGGQTGLQVLFSPGIAAAKHTEGVSGATDVQMAMATLLQGTGLSYRRDGDMFVIVSASGADDPQSGSAAGGGADSGTVQALIVTAQKREEQIQDVPIAISAFTQKSLEEQKIEGGYDLLKAIPNVTFSKSNFSSYNFSIRGVGTKAVSATTDPGVAVAFNNTTLIQNRLFEQEYFDVERVEVLRGPQGTLFGRNATSGVINVISAKPKLNHFEASLKGEVGNYDSQRWVGMINIPIIDDVLAIRLAGAGTQRDGYDYNEITHHNVNGRNLWGTRLTIGFSPTEQIRADLIWEHFQEDDDRSRTGKQLCHTDPGPAFIGETSTVRESQFASPLYLTLLGPALFSQSCLPGSLYDDAAYGTPNGIALPFVFSPLTWGAAPTLGTMGYIDGQPTAALKLADPYGGLKQSRDLRTIASIRDPIYRAKSEVVELNLGFDITDALTLSSQTAYSEDEVYSFQDYNRFNSFPIFSDTSRLEPFSGPYGQDWRAFSPGGVFCDPQIGCSDRLAGFDISQAVGKQFSQELRLQSDFDGPLNFSVGTNYTKFDTVIDYYVMYNLITALAESWPFYYPVDGVMDITTCPYSGLYVNRDLGLPGGGPVPAGSPTANCPYIDPNPVESINGEGHNYFRSKNPYSLKSSAVFGELYWNVADGLKITAGLRYTDDNKSFTPVPSQILLAPGLIGGGTVSRGYPEKDPILQEWGEWTGRLGVDWKPDFGFTDQTLLYAFYSHGYKGGGANPPSPGFATIEETRAYLESLDAPDFVYDSWLLGPVLELKAVDYNPTFEPEFVDSIEVGAKNTLLGGAATLNITSFYYDYKDYQVSQIKDRTAVNENFDATIWGFEFESTFSVSRDFNLNANLGYLDTSIADGATSIDIANRTQSDPNYVIVKPWPQLPSNCVVPAAVAESFLNSSEAFYSVCGGWHGVLGYEGRVIDPNPAFGGGLLPYNVDNYPVLNGGAGIRAQLGGNELPNAPHWTTNVGARYGRDILDGSWRVVMRGDAYWQSQSWARVYNAVNDKLHGWYNFNVSVRLENEALGLAAEFYVKNLLDKSPITDAFLNSDDTGLTTNVFVLDPRLIGFNVRKTF